MYFFFFSSRRRHTRSKRDWSSDVCSSDLLVSFDVNYRNLMWDDDEAAATRAVRSILPYVDLLKISEEEAGMVGGEGNLPAMMVQIGRASCRERGEVAVATGTVNERDEPSG